MQEQGERVKDNFAIFPIADCQLPVLGSRRLSIWQSAIGN
jgi:hypothetical protein